MHPEHKCAKCGAVLRDDAPKGLCPGCLLAAALDPAPPVADKPTIRVEAIAEEELNRRIGRYKILQKLGEGGCGVVYMAEQTEPVRRKVALKVIKLGLDTRQVIARFEAERQALALMDHPNIAKVLDAGTTDSGRPYFVMELVKGIRITEYCDQNHLATSERLNLFTQVCQAIQHAHQKGIIHRDIKPSNILVTLHDGVPVPKVIDFGIAKATEQPLTEKTVFTAFGQFMGTPAYMSPEQAELGGLDIDTRSDIYALGVLLYELLTGRTPFDAKELLQAGLDEMRRRIREEEPVRPSTRLSTMADADLTEVAQRRQSEPAKLARFIRGDLDWIVMKCLEKDRNRRYETANGLAMDLRRYLNDEPVVARPPSQLYRFRKLVRRNKLGFAAGGTVAAALLAGTIVSTWLFFGERQAERAVRTQAERADRNAAQETRQRQRAETAAQEASKTLATSDFLQASRLLAQDKAPDALAYLERGLAFDPANLAAQTRLTSLLAYHQWMVPVLSLKHSDGVFCVQFSPDGSRIVTASRDGTARVWDAQSGRPLTEPMKHGGVVNSAGFSPDGKLIATASWDNSARVWEARTGQPLTEPMKHEGWVSLAQFSPDGKRIVTASLGTARVWDAQSGQALTQPMTHGGFVNSVDFSLDGTRMVSASQDGTARVWDAQSGQALTEPLRHRGGVRSAQFSPDGKRILTASEDTTARLWDAQSGEPLTEPMRHGGTVTSAQFNPDGSRIVTASEDHTVRVWAASSGQPLTEPIKHRSEVFSARFSPDGKRIVTVSSGGVVRVLETPSGQALAEPLNHGGEVLCAQFSPDGERIATAASHGIARVWDQQGGPGLAEPMKHGGAIRAAQFSPNGTQIVTASDDGTAQVWDAKSGQPLTKPMKHGSSCFLAQFSPDGKWVVSASRDNTARVWDAQTGRPLTEPMKHTGEVHSAQFSPDGKWVVTASRDKTARGWDASSGQAVTEPILHGNEVTSAQFSPDGRRIVTASGDGAARVWEAQTGRPLTQPIKCVGRMFSAQFSPDGRRIVTAAGDGTAQVWEAQTGQPLTQPMKHGAPAFAAQFSPDGQRVVTASKDNTARVWDAQTGQPLMEPIKHRNAVIYAQFSPDGQRVLPASEDGTAQVWDLCPLARRMPDWVPRLAEALAGQVLNQHGVLEASATSPPELIAQVRQELGQGQDGDDWIIWGRWFLADPATRTVSPFSKVTVSEFIENRIKENTVESLATAERLALGNTGLRERIAGARKHLDEAAARSATGERDK